LHAKFPDIYKDPNPKPELAIAISRFTALYGFRPAEQIVEFGRRFPQLLQIIGEREFRDLEISGSPVAFKKVYSSLMHASRCKVKEVIDSILQSSDNEGSVVEVARDLNDQYPGGDVGVLSVFFLNIVDLLPGQAIFIGPNVPHAYLSGDLIECMTCSDNVIRGGLTSKFKDVETLLASLDYACSGPPKLLLQTRDQTWSPENVPFAVKEYKGGSFEIKPETESPAIALVIEGEGSVGSVSVKRGKSLLLIPGIAYRVESEYIRIFIAFTPKNYII
jgi:mannose-6-phosphate isomerase